VLLHYVTVIQLAYSCFVGCTEGRHYNVLLAADVVIAVIIMVLANKLRGFYDRLYYYVLKLVKGNRSVLNNDYPISHVGVMMMTTMMKRFRTMKFTLPYSYGCRICADQSNNQSKHTFIAPCVASKSEAMKKRN